MKEQVAGQNFALIDALQLVVLELEKADARQARAIRVLLGSTGTLIGPYNPLSAEETVADGFQACGSPDLRHVVGHQDLGVGGSR